MNWLFKKRKMLIGFRLTEVSQGKEKIVLEGYWDGKRGKKFFPKKENDYIVEALYEEVRVPFWELE